MKLNTMLLAATALVGATGAQAQTATFQFDPSNSFVDVTSNSTLCLGSCSLKAALATSFPTFTLSQGDSESFDFATFTIKGGFGVGTADIDAQLAFLQPTVGTATTDGTADYFRLGGVFRPGVSGGTLTWDNPVQQFTTANGSMFTVSFGDLASLQPGGKMTDRVTITLDKVPAVPEPATWALMILGFGMVGAGVRYRRKETRVSFA